MVNKSMLLMGREWKVFYIGGNSGIFDIVSTSSGIDKSKLNLSGGSIPYVTRSDKSNGIDIFVSDEQSTKYSMDNNNVISIGLDTQTVFYQPYKFFTGQNIQVLSNKSLNKYNAKFIDRLLKAQLQKFNWGGNGATLGRLARTKIMLPVNDNGEPDYDFMEEFVKEQEHNKKQEYITYVKKKLSTLEYKEVEPLEDKEWKEFYIGALFTVRRPNARSEKQYIEGDTPFVASGNFHNGVVRCCEPTQGEILDSRNCITVSPVDGSTFYQPVDFIGRGGAGSSILILQSNKMNCYVGLFLSRMIQQTSSKYSYGKMGNQESIKREKIMLPTNKNGDPDYEYMEQYIKNIMFQKYTDYLKYVKAID